jgi:hypothetical protein
LILLLRYCWLQGSQNQTQIHLRLVHCWLQELMWLQMLLLSLQERQTQRRGCCQLERRTLGHCLPQELHQTQVQMLLLLVLRCCWHQTGWVCCPLLELRLMLQSRRLLERRNR